jgi:2-polyprenyl-6-methoxyphenol hydroxylase-like FAD-dependent oxidoreductase
MSSLPLSVLIIGAGTGGLCLAHRLKQAGIEVAVYERDRTRADGLYGYRIGIDPDGSRALHDCLPPELFETFLATCARPPRYFTMLTEQLSEVFSVNNAIVTDSSDLIYSDKSVSRMTLRQVLLTGLEDIVHFNKVFCRYEQNPDGTVTAFFEDGTSATGSVLVAADGSHSRVRKQYLPQAQLVDSGIVGILAKVELTSGARDLLPQTMLEGVSMIFAPQGYSCIFHTMEFKWGKDGKLKLGVGSNDARLISQWPGMLYDNTRDYIMFAFAAARQKFSYNPMSRKGDDLIDLVDEMTYDWHLNLRKLFHLADPSTCLPLNISTSFPIPAWPSSNVTLLGDAIHTMTPGRGVGANTALRDARLLGKKLIAVRDGQIDLIEGIHEYEAKMIKYGFDAVMKSRTQMDCNSPIHKPVIGRVMLTGMRTAMRVTNHLPPLKRRIEYAQSRFRGAGREED